MHAFDFLNTDVENTPHFCVLFGEEPLLHDLVAKKLLATSSRGNQESVSRLEGAGVKWRDVHDELSMRSLFGAGNRVVFIQNADDFVSNYRSELESFVDDSHVPGTLVLAVKSWPGNTRLAKKTKADGLAIACKPPERKAGKRAVVDTKKLAEWLVERAATVHQLKLSAAKMNRIIDLAGSNLGLLDQELAKLALFVTPSQAPSDELITQVVGGWREETTWELIDAACLGETEKALGLLDRLLQSGEAPQALFGAISWSLRRFAKAVRLIETSERRGRRINLRDALVAAGFSKFPHQRLDENERQLRHLGRQRAGQLFQWLLDTDVRLKRTHSSGDRARWALELLVIRLSSKTVAA